MIVPEHFSKLTKLWLLLPAGHSGRVVEVQANYFKLCSVTDWVLYQYHVDFAPEEDRTNVRKAMMREHRSQIGGYLFDGMILYTSHRLADNVRHLIVTFSWPLLASPVCMLEEC